MNASRGFGRLWLVASALWIAFIIGLAWVSALGGPISFSGRLNELQSFLLIPPIVVAILFKLLRWIVRGFYRA